ncbi:hypothetical protein [Nocardia sp. NPDC050413]|uniref:hypothetical protein n=1 Tax=Nocardia sp. NPDC050413 TaxID=3155784 RepID=UPI0033FEBC88
MVKDAAELERRRRWYDGWLREWDVSLLIELGHLEEVTRRAGQGDWFCAHGLAAVQHRNGRHDAAIEVLRPFAETGWWTAIEAVATVLADCGRTGEALALCRSKVVSGDRDAIAYSVKLLADAGRAGEAVDLLLPGVEARVHMRALVTEVAMYGHFLGSAAAVRAMHQDQRILAAANLDGALRVSSHRTRESVCATSLSPSPV